MQYAMDESNSDNDDDDNYDNSDDEQNMERDDNYKYEEGTANGNTHRQHETHIRYDKQSEMACQERDLRRYRALIRNKLRQKQIAAKVNAPDVIYYTSVMNVPSAHV